MGRVFTDATIGNLRDLWATEEGLLSPEEARKLNLDDALVDTNATTLAMPTRLIQELGLTQSYVKQATSSRGTAPANVYEAIRLTILDRCCTVDVIEFSDNDPVLIGGISLLMMDLVVDVEMDKLTGNPAHDGEQILELYGNMFCNTSAV